MGSTTSGYSWFYPTDGLDEGEILLQWECAIAPDDTVIELYFKNIYPHAVNSVLTVCDLFRAGNPPRTIQDEALATYERRCTARHAKIDWFKPAEQVYNLIRGSNPAPGSWTTKSGETLNIFDARLVVGDGIAGRIMSISDEGFVVQSVGGRILVKRVKLQGGAKLPAAEWAQTAGLKVGDSLGD
jgi:methionyl-tRNA formyltransferase